MVISGRDSNHSLVLEKKSCLTTNAKWRDHTQVKKGCPHEFQEKVSIETLIQENANVSFLLLNTIFPLLVFPFIFLRIQSGKEARTQRAEEATIQFPIQQKKKVASNWVGSSPKKKKRSQSLRLAKRIYQEGKGRRRKLERSHHQQERTNEGAAGLCVSLESKVVTQKIEGRKGRGEAWVQI